MEKQKALQKIEQINRVLMDREKITPISGKIFIGWGVAISIIIYVIPLIFFNQEFSVIQKLLYSLGSFILFFGITFIFEYFFVKGENIKAGFAEFTKLQKNIERIYILSVIVGVILTLSLGLTGGWFFIFSIWFFLIGIAYYATGLMFKEIFKTYGLILLAVGAGLSIYGIVLTASNYELSYKEKEVFFYHIFTIGKYLAFSILGVGHIVLGILVERGKKIV